MKRKRFLRSIILGFIIIFIFNVSENTVKSISQGDFNNNLVILVDINEKRIYLVDEKKNII
ncbi:hypothetical protein UT300005_10180 [Clostridium sp. CTA-5]